MKKNLVLLLVPGAVVFAVALWKQHNPLSSVQSPQSKAQRPQEADHSREGSGFSPAPRGLGVQSADQSRRSAPKGFGVQVGGQASGKVPAPAAASELRVVRVEPAAVAPTIQDSTNSLTHSVSSLLADFHGRMSSAGAGRSAEEVKALVAEREKATRQFVDQLAALGPGNARPIADLYKQIGAVNDRLLLAEALGKIQDPEAVGALGDLLTGEQGFFERQGLINALGHRTESEAVNPLATVLVGDAASGLKFAAVQALSGKADGLPALDVVIESGADSAVQLEAIRSVGRMRTDAARVLLTGLAQKSALPTLVRQTAIQELRRSFGSAVVEVIQGLSADPEAPIRDCAVQALAMLQASPSQ